MPEIEDEHTHLIAAMWILGDQVYSLRLTVAGLRDRIDILERELILTQNAPARRQNNDNEGDRSDDDGFIHDAIVEGCGIPEINGTYSRDGASDGVSMYSQTVIFHDYDTRFTLFRCRLTDLTR
jgi:hypothetical protein